MKRIIWIVLIIAGLGGLIAYRLSANRKEATKQTEMRAARKGAPAAVSTARSSIRDVVGVFETVGTVEAPLNVRVSARVAARLVEVTVSEGDRVVAGQVIARLDGADVEADVRQRRAALAEAESRLSQARINQSPTNVSVNTLIRQQQAASESAAADLGQVTQNYASQLAAAESTVDDMRGRIAAAEAAGANARASIRSAQASLDNSRARLARLADLLRQGFIAAQDVDDARTAVAVQEAALDVARGQAEAVAAQLGSATAQKRSAEQQLSIVRTKGRADIEAARARSAQAQAALEYARANAALKPAYAQSLEALRSAVEGARASLRNAQSKLADTVLVSSVSGYVTGRFMDPGTVATPGQAIVALQAIHQVWVTVPIPEEVSGRIALGQEARVRFDALPGVEAKGRVTQYNPAADAQTRQFAVRVTLENPGDRIKPGTFARAVFETERLRRAVVVPREAIQRGPEGPAVFTISADGKAQRRAVEPGPSDDSVTAIRSGLAAGEVVVTLSSAPLREGQAVRAADPSAGGSKGARGRSKRGGRSAE